MSRIAGPCTCGVVFDKPCRRHPKGRATGVIGGRRVRRWSEPDGIPCPDEDKHTNDPTEPRGYPGWHEWAERKAKTHEQKQCPTCGLYVIWEPKGH